LGVAATVDPGGLARAWPWTIALFLVPVAVSWVLVRLPPIVTALIACVVMATAVLAVARDVPRLSDSDVVAYAVCTGVGGEFDCAIRDIDDRFARIDESAESIPVPLDGSLVVRTTTVERPAPAWFLGPRRVVVGIEISASTSERGAVDERRISIARVRALDRYVRGVEDALAGAAFTETIDVAEAPSDPDAFLQEGRIAISPTQTDS
jgi:hypothetical protein